MGKTRLLAVAACAAAVVGVGASAAFAGEVTGNGKPTAAPDNANSPCAFSGQEDRQFFTADEGEILKPGGPTKGDPAHAQSWGQIIKAVGPLGGANDTTAGPEPWGCNASLWGLKN